MFLKTRPLVEIGAGVLALIAVGWSYLRSREVAVRADTEHQVNETLRKQMAQMSADYEKKIADRQVKFEHDNKSLQAQFEAAAKDNHRMSALLSQLMNLPEAVAVTTPAPTPQNPTPLPVVSVPQIDFPAVIAYAKGCEATKLANTKCRDDLSDRMKQMDIAQKQIDALKKENRDLLSAAHGTFFQNFKKAGKWLTIGAGVGAAAVCGSGHCR